MTDPIEDSPVDRKDDDFEWMPPVTESTPAGDDATAAVQCDRCGARRRIEAAAAVCTTDGLSRARLDPGWSRQD